MTTQIDRDKKISAIIAEIELPDSAYDQAVERYDELAKWFSRPESSIARFEPRVFVQGSFALGTAIKPVDPNEDFDLDLTAKLQAGISVESHSQKELKKLLGLELESYRLAKKIQEPLEPKRRCWRLNYRSKPGFHMDTVPGIPENESRRGELTTLMERHQVPRQLAQEIANNALSITDEKHPNYATKGGNWPSSNPEGYVAWFLSKARGAQLNSGKAATQVGDVPLYRQKTTLQRVVQLLKWHRDWAFKDKAVQQSKPISIIITTLAASSYKGEVGLAASLEAVLRGLEEFAASRSSSVLNPVNPQENFADKWEDHAYGKFRLKENFRMWVGQASRDFKKYLAAVTPDILKEEVERDLGLRLSKPRLDAAFAGAITTTTPQPRSPTRVEISREAPRPWARQ